MKEITLQRACWMLLTGSWQGQKSSGAAGRAAYKAAIPVLCPIALLEPPPLQQSWENVLFMWGASESLKFRDVTLRFPGTPSGLCVPFKYKQAHAFPSASLPVVTVARESSGGTIHPSLPQSKDSSLLLDEYINSTIPLEAGFQVATRTTLPLSCYRVPHWEANHSYISSTLQAAHFSH